MLYDNVAFVGQRALTAVEDRNMKYNEQILKVGLTQK